MNKFLDNIERWEGLPSDLKRLELLWETPYYEYLNFHLTQRAKYVLDTDWFRNVAREYKWYPILDTLGVAHDDKLLFSLIVTNNLTPTMPNLKTLLITLFNDTLEKRIEVLSSHHIRISIKPPILDFSTQAITQDLKDLEVMEDGGTRDKLYVRTPLDDGFNKRWSTFQYFVNTLAKHSGLHVEYYIIP